MKICTSCLLPETYKNITFDSHGVCNYCLEYESFRPRLESYPVDLFNQRADRVKGKYPYDALIGISGGKDSSYILYKMVKDYGLKVLAYTFDNGFLTDYGRENIARMVKALGVDHFYFKAPWEVHREFYKGAVEKLGLPCLGCSYLIAITTHRVAFERNIPLIIHGRSPYQMFKEMSERSLDPFLPFIKSNLSPYDSARVKHAASLSLKKALKVLKPISASPLHEKQVREAFFPDLEAFFASEEVPELLGWFLYEPYDEVAMMDVLEREFDWKRPDSRQAMTHNDCIIHDAAAYIYKESLGYPLLAQELSTAVRRGELTRMQAEERLAEEQALSQRPDNDLKELCRLFGLEYSRLDSILSSARRKHRLLRAFIRIKTHLSRLKRRDRSTPVV